MSGVGLALPEGALIIPADMRNLSEIEAPVIEKPLLKAAGGAGGKIIGINRTTLYAKLPKVVADAEAE